MNAKKATSKAKSQSQRERFIEAAKEAGCSDEETAFDAALKKIGKAKVAERPPAKKPK